MLARWEELSLFPGALPGVKVMECFREVRSWLEGEL